MAVTPDGIGQSEPSGERPELQERKNGVYQVVVGMRSTDINWCWRAGFGVPCGGGETILVYLVVVIFSKANFETKRSGNRR